MADLIWPSVLVPSSESWRLSGGALSGGRSLAGTEQVVVGPSAFWKATLTIPCNTRETVLAFRALMAGLDGRARTVLVGPIEASRAPWAPDPLTGGRISYGRAAGDAARDPAWGTNPDTGGALGFEAGETIPMNATSVTIRRTRGGLLVPGMHLELLGRLHTIAALGAPDLGGSVVTATIRPWARYEYLRGTPIEFGTPRATMRLASDDTGALDLQLSRSGVVTLDLVEAF